MVQLGRKPIDFLTIVCCLSLLICAFLCSNVYSSPKNKTTYQEIKKDGRIYVFSSLSRKQDFEKSGELGKGIIKIGYGPNGETVVFDSDDAAYNYDSKQIRQTLDNLNINAYKEFEKEGRIYVFTSPERKAGFEKSGEMGKDFIAKIGYGAHGKTVLFDSHDAVMEYDRRHEGKTATAAETNNYYRQIEMDGRLYVFTSSERMKSFGRSGEVGISIIKIGYGPNGETVIFDSDEAVTEYEKRNIRKKTNLMRRRIYSYDDTKIFNYNGFFMVVSSRHFHYRTGKRS
ncbi:MAG: hypothetical protein ACE5GV_02410 [Candidatus Scalindua sp.]